MNRRAYFSKFCLTGAINAFLFLAALLINH